MKKKQPFFSIITCTRNSGKFLSRNIASVIVQTFHDYEHIFIDGYSNDVTVSLIEQYQSKFRRAVRLCKSRPLGISNAMNIGIKMAKGKYILILHSDDSLHNKDVLKYVYTCLSKNPKLDWIYGKINVIEKDGKSIGQYPSRKIYELLPKYFLKYYNFIPHQAVFMKKSVFNKFGFFDESLSSSMDIDLWLRIKDETVWNFLDDIISNYMIRDDAQSSAIKNRLINDKNRLKVEKRYLNSFELLIYKIVESIVERYNKTRR